MRRSCFSLRGGVIAIGVLSAIVSTLLGVGMVAAYITLEEHVAACREGRGTALDTHSLMPSCIMLTDASFVLSSRVFVLIQVSLWLLLLIFSVLLVVGAVKGRGGLLVPWVVLTLVVMGSIVYDAVRAGLSNNTSSLLMSCAALLAACVCLVIVHQFSRQLNQRQKDTEASARALLSTPLYGTGLHHRTPPLLYVGRYPGCGVGGDVVMCHDLPPDYATAEAEKPNRKPLPTGLGVRR